MTDFYALLKKSILDRGITDSNERDEIYAQARRAMVRRLWAFDPPLEEDEIESRIGAFDMAVSDIEVDVMAEFGREAAEAPPDDGDDYDYDDPEPRDDYQPSDDYAPQEAPPRNARQLPALAPQPRELAQRVRDAALVRYHEEARQVPVDEPEPYSDPYDDADMYAPPPATRSRSLAPAGRQRRRPEPADPYAVPEQADREDRRSAPPPPRRPASERWVELPEPRRKPAEKQRRTPQDDLPRKRRRARQLPPPRPRRRLTDGEKIRILLGAIGLCVAVLIGIGVYLLLPRNDGVTVDVGDHREVSDAATAVRIAQADLPVDQTFMLFDGRDPTVFETSPDNPVRFDANSGAVEISSSTGSPGVKALIGPGLATRLAGHDVRITIVARSSPEAGAATMRFAYQSGVAISHWQTANLGADYQAVAMTWRVPGLRTDRGGDLLVIQPGVPGDGNGADIKSIKIDLLQAQS